MDFVNTQLLSTYVGFHDSIKQLKLETFMTMSKKLRKGKVPVQTKFPPIADFMHACW